MRFRKILGMLGCIGVFGFQASAQDFCSEVLDYRIMNVGSSEVLERFSRITQDKLCETEWKSEADFRAKARSVNLSYESALETIGAGSSKSASSQSIREALSNYCKKSNDEIAYSREFYNRYRDGNLAISAWRDCMERKSSGIYAISIPSVDMTGVTITVINKNKGDRVPFSVYTVSPNTQKADLFCEMNGVPLLSAKFPAATGEVSFSCHKAAFASVSFEVSSSWGNLGHFELPGIEQTHSALWERLALINQILTDHMEDMDQKIREQEQSLFKPENYEIIREVVPFNGSGHTGVARQLIAENEGVCFASGHGGTMSWGQYEIRVESGYWVVWYHRDPGKNVGGGDMRATCVRFVRR